MSTPVVRAVASWPTGRPTARVASTPALTSVDAAQTPASVVPLEVFQ